MTDYVVERIDGHWAIIGRVASSRTGERFHVRQEPVKLEPAEIGIAKRYLEQAIKSATRGRDSGTTVVVPDSVMQRRIASVGDQQERHDALSAIVTELCICMNRRGTPNPGIVFALEYSSGGERGSALIKADLNQKQLAQLTETADSEGRMHLSDAADIIEEPQSEFAKVLFAPAPYDASLDYAILNRKASKSQSAAYFLQALGVQTSSTAGTLRRVLDAVGKEAAPDTRARRIDRVLAAAEDERLMAPGGPVTLERLAERRC